MLALAFGIVMPRGADAKREGGREGERERLKERESNRKRARERERANERDRERAREGESERDRERERERERARERETVPRSSDARPASKSSKSESSPPNDSSTLPRANTAVQSGVVRGYRGTSLTRNIFPLGPYGRPMPRALWWS